MAEIKINAHKNRPLRNSECSTEFKKITAVDVKVQGYKGESEKVCI